MKVSVKRVLVQFIFFSFLILPYLLSLVQPVFLKVHLRVLFLPGPVCPDTSTVSCVFGELQRTLSFDLTYLANNILLPTFLALIGILLIAGVVFGRAFCGWACPLGFVQDIFARMLQLFGKQQKKLPYRLHYMLIGLKHAILFVFMTFLASVGITFVLNKFLGEKVRFTLGTCGRTPFCVLCPVPILFGVIPSIVINGQFPSLSYTQCIQFASFIFLIVSALAVERSWCKYICPMGALLSLFNKASLLHIAKNQNKCTSFCRGHQRDCNKICPMRIEVSRNKEPSSSLECIFCYNCAESCSNKAIKYKLS